MKRLKKHVDSAKQHVLYWGENYILLPVVVVGLIASIWFVNVLTGRQPLEDVGAIVGWLINALGICVVASLTGLTQQFLFGYQHKKYPSIASGIIDSCVTCFLLLLWSVLIFGLIR